MGKVAIETTSDPSKHSMLKQLAVGRSEKLCGDFYWGGL